MPDVTLVLVHGINSSSATWGSLLARLESDQHLTNYRVIPVFEYEAKALRRFGRRRSPTQADVAVQLATHIKAHVPDDREIVFIAHSQGGLIVQRLIANYLEAGRGNELTRVRCVVLLACPNSGSQTLTVARKFTGAILNPQEKSLRVLDAEIEQVRSVVLERAVHAQTVSGATCPIAFRVYAGATDGIVDPTTAKGLFPSNIFGILPGDHSSILDFSDPVGTGYLSLQADLLTPHRSYAVLSPNFGLGGGLFERIKQPPAKLPLMRVSETASDGRISRSLGVDIFDYDVAKLWIKYHRNGDDPSE